MLCTPHFSKQNLWHFLELNASQVPHYKDEKSKNPEIPKWVTSVIQR